MDILEKIEKYLDEQKVVTKVEHPGILEVPEGKAIETLPLSHFVGLARTKGRGPVVRALMNLARWMKTKDPELARWAKDMQEKVSAALEKE